MGPGNKVKVFRFVFNIPYNIYMKKNIKMKALTTFAAATGIAVATVAQACASGGGEVQSQNELLVQQTLINLNNSGAVPTPGSNESVVFNEILDHLQRTEPSIENITQISILDPESSISINTEEGTVTVNANFKNSNNCCIISVSGTIR